jgi:uncharacterized protein YggU (UPF0235/DUF167 family)
MYIHLKVQAGAKEETFVQLNETHFSATVREKAERNAANTRVIALIKERFPDAGRVTIVSGHHSPSKLFSVEMPGEQ